MPIDRRTIAVPALVMAMGVGGCQQTVEDRNGQLEKIIQAYNKDEQLKDLRAVFVLTEEGCLPCSKAFAGILEKYLDDPTCLFLVCASGADLDISPYRSSGKRVVWDYDDRMRGSGILAGSGTIVLHDGKIDTIVKIGDARTVAGALAYTSNLLQMRSDSIGAVYE